MDEYETVEEHEKLRKFEENRNRLITFYRTHRPDLLDTVDETLKTWEGQEEQLFEQLHEKYLGQKEAEAEAEEDYREVVQGLKESYRSKLRPLEEAYKFDSFFSPLLEDSDFDAKPMVLLLGQYSVGKTSFIKYLLGRDFPGIRIGPEPTTERFVAVMHGKEDSTVPGHAAASDPSKPFRALGGKFGNNFLSRMECSHCSSKLLQNMTLIDTPGVLSGEKQRIGRQYSFTGVVEWFAERSDRILLLFDAHKLDISDEFKRVIETLNVAHIDKLRVVLNKADSISPQQLMRVYGALMWSLGKVIKTPEVVRVYISSFWDHPIDPEHENSKLFEAEREDLLSDLMSLPRNSAIRKVNELVKRARIAKVHAHIMAHLRSEMPSFWGKSKKQQQLLDDLPNEFARIGQKYKVAPGDFPNIARFRKTLLDFDLGKFPTQNKKLMAKVDQILVEDIPAIMRKMRHPLLDREASQSKANPFADSASQSGSRTSTDWVISSAAKTNYDNRFHAANPEGGKLRGGADGTAKRALMEAGSGLSTDTLFKIWGLSDIDKDGCLDSDEFAVAMYLIDQYNEGHPVPEMLPPKFVPPSKR